MTIELDLQRNTGSSIETTSLISIFLKELEQHINIDRYIDLSLPIFNSFDQRGLSNLLCDQDYIVVFESIQHPNIDHQLLLTLDHLAYKEALGHRGLKGYFTGPLHHPSRVCRSFCIWSSQEMAQESARHGHHQLAIQHTQQFYEYFRLRRYSVIKKESDAIFTELEDE